MSLDTGIFDTSTGTPTGGYFASFDVVSVALYTFLQILSVHSFEKIPILQAFSHDDPNPAPITLTKQLNLFNT
jgi:hypothetical protein